MTITEFLEARIAEDEAVARAALEDQRSVPIGATIFHRSALDHIARHDPARVLAECAAKRAILAGRKRIDRSASDGEWSMGYSDANYEAIKALANIYKDHPDYLQEWAL